MTNDSILVCQLCGHSVAQDTTKLQGSEFIVEELRENILPFHSETSAVEKDIDDASNILQVLDKEIISLTAALKALGERKQSVEAFVSQRKAVTAPIRRVPPELLLAIFSLVCEGNRFGYSNHVKRDAPTIRLSQTCYLWRSLCLSTPELWSRICTIANDSPEDFLHERYGYRNDTPLFELYLARSRDHLLTVEMDGDYDSIWPTHVSEQDFNMASDLLDESNSFKTLIINPSILIELFIDNGNQPSFPNLKDLTIRSYESLIIDDQAITHFLDSPIKTLRFHAVAIRQFEMPWQSIESVTLSRCSLDDLRYLQGVAQGINSLRIEDMDAGFPNVDYSGDTIEFPSLKKLSIDIGSHTIGLTDLLRCPSLLSLDVESSLWIESTRLDKLLSPEPRIIPPLSRASFYCPYVGVTKIKRSLQTLSNIQVLHLDFFGRSLRRGGGSRRFKAEDISSFFAIASKTDKHNKLLLPHLSELSIAAYRIIIDSRIIEFLESRRAPEVPKRLERISLERGISKHEMLYMFYDPDQPPISEVACATRNELERLRRLRADGLHISINSDWSPLSDLRCLK